MNFGTEPTPAQNGTINDANRKGEDCKLSM